MPHFPRRSKLTLAGFLLLASAGAVAAAEPQAGSRTPVLQHLLDCKDKTEAAERLACYDAAVSEMAQAEKAGDIVVVDREQARTVRKQAFGFNLPSFSLFERGEKPEMLDQVTLAVESAYLGRDGRWVIEADGGGVWTQTEGDPPFNPPHKGSTAEVRRGALGSYFMNIDGQRAVRVRRVR